MSFTLLKANLKANRLIWLLITGIYSFYAVLIVSMYDPENMDAMAAMMEMLPEEMVNAFGISFGTSLLTHISGILYSMLLYLFPLIITVIVNHRLVASHVDKGSMAYLLSTSNSRGRIAVTQAIFSLLSISLVFVIITLVQLLISSAMFPGELEVDTFILLNVHAWLLYCAISGICFFASCISNETRYSLGLGAGLPITFIIFDMLGNTGDNIGWIGNLSIYALFDPAKLFAGEPSSYWGMGILACIAALLYTGAILLFKKRNLPL